MAHSFKGEFRLFSARFGDTLWNTPRRPRISTEETPPGGIPVRHSFTYAGLLEWLSSSRASTAGASGASSLGTAGAFKAACTLSWTLNASGGPVPMESRNPPNVDGVAVWCCSYHADDMAVNWYYRKGFKDATYHATQKGRQGRQRVEGVRVDSKTLRMFLPILHRTKEDKFDLFVEHYADKIIVLHASMEASDSKIVKYVANHADFEARHREGEKVVTTNRRWLLARHRLDGGDVVDKPLNVHRQFTSKLKKYLQNSENKVIGRFWRTLDTNQSLSLAVYYGFAEDVLKLS